MSPQAGALPVRGTRPARARLLAHASCALCWMLCVPDVLRCGHEQECSGGSICPHKRVRSKCVHCLSLCKHGVFLSCTHCVQCIDESSKASSAAFQRDKPRMAKEFVAHMVRAAVEMFPRGPCPDVEQMADGSLDGRSIMEMVVHVDAEEAAKRNIREAQQWANRCEEPGAVAAVLHDLGHQQLPSGSGGLFGSRGA